MNRPVAIDLFSGAGGLSLGFEQAGFDVIAAVEIDPIHAAVHKFNFPHCYVFPRSVIGLSGEEIRRLSGLKDRRVDVVAGGAPCQGFSLIGHRVLEDPRNSLVNEFVRIVTELDANYFLFENVKGLTLGKHKKFLEELIEAFDQRGYHVRLPWKVLNAAYFGIPQERERFFLMGAKKGCPLPEYPEPTNIPFDNNQLSIGLPRGPSCRDALGDLPNPEEFDTLIDKDAISIPHWEIVSDYARKMHCYSIDDWEFGYRRRWDSNFLTSSMRTFHTEITRRRFSETKPGSVEPISRFFKLPPEGLSNTLRAGTDAARGAFTSPRPIHYEFPRCITVREMARLHGFPDWFRFHETKWHGARQIGNAVPPPLARTIASEIIKVLGRKASKPQEILDLGNNNLLTMDMSEAASFWQVDKPNGRRDRKSGARKRKQKEIEIERIASL